MYKWSCPDSRTWERYILDKDMPEKESLMKHLSDCSLCRFYVEQKTEEYKRLSDEWSAISGDNIIHLSPAQWVEDSDYDQNSLLAAQGMNGREITSITLSSEDNRVLLKAIRDAHTDDTWLYLLSDNPDDYKGALIRPFGTNKEFLLDSQGRANMGKVAWPLPDPDRAEIHLPDATFTLDTLELPVKKDRKADFEISGGDRVMVSIDETDRVSQITVRLVPADERGTAVAYRMALVSSDNIELFHIKSGVGNEVSLDKPPAGGKLDIYLYQSKTE